MTTTLWAAAAQAQEAPTVEPGPVEIEAGAFALQLDDDGEVQVVQVGLPEPVVIDPKFRTCRLAFTWTGEAIEGRLLDGCHPNLQGAVTESLAHWRFDVGEPPGRQREVLEVWTVFPDERGEPVRLFARRSFDVDLTATTDVIGLLPFRVVGRQFIDYPLEAVGIDTTITRCDVKVDVSGTGVPHGVEVSRCDEVFHAAAEEALRKWRFAGNTLDGVPYQTGFTLGVDFTRQYDRPDGKPGIVEVLLPDDAEVGRMVRREDLPAPARVAPKKATWDPLFVLDHKHYAEVGVYDIVWPTPVAGDEDRRCPMLFQTNSERLVWAWADEGCHPEVEAAAVAAGNRWNLEHGDVQPGERYARFRGTLMFPADGGHVQLEVPVDDLVTPSRDLPDHVHTFAELEIVSRVPPKLPRAFATEVLSEQLICELEVQVTAAGRAGEIEPTTCPEAVAPYAVKALKRWRWRPPERDGERVATVTRVSMRIDNSP